MAHIYQSITELIGNTPLVAIDTYSKYHNLKTTLLVKLEMLNPGGSVKERIALAMIEAAEKKGLLQKGATIIEPTSGNTGIGLALVGAAKGYKVILTMPDTMSVERRLFLQAYGAKVVLTDGKEGIKGSIAKAEELAHLIKHSFIPSQFTNMENPATHYKTTAVEIWNDTEGKIDIFVAGVGTGGTISGCGSYLKSRKSSIEIVAVEPATSAVLSTGVSGSHKIQGIGAGFVPKTLETSIYDEVITIEDEEAFQRSREIAHLEGIFVGISSGAALAAATKVAQREKNREKQIVVMLPDSGDRYLSTSLVQHN